MYIIEMECGVHVCMCVYCGWLGVFKNVRHLFAILIPRPHANSFIDRLVTIKVPNIWFRKWMYELSFGLSTQSNANHTNCAMYYNCCFTLQQRLENLMFSIWFYLRHTQWKMLSMSTKTIYIGRLQNFRAKAILSNYYI